jgi:hypothetical protein
MAQSISANKRCDCDAVISVISVDRPTFVSVLTTTHHMWYSLSGGRVHRLRALAGNNSREDGLYMLSENIAFHCFRFAEVGSSSIGEWL